MVDICPFKAQERMNDVCKNNYFSPRTKQSYTKLSKLENTNKKGCPRFPEQPLLFSFYTLCIKSSIVHILTRFQSGSVNMSPTP